MTKIFNVTRIICSRQRDVHQDLFFYPDLSGLKWHDVYSSLTCDMEYLEYARLKLFKWMNDSFSNENISFDLSFNDPLQINQDELKDEIKASAFYKVNHTSKFFKAWRILSGRSKRTTVNEVKFMRWKIEYYQERYFFKWLDFYHGIEKLHNLGEKILITKNFDIWINYVRSQYLAKYNFRKVIIERRKIYMMSFLKKWRYAISLKRKYEYYCKYENKMFGNRIIKAFYLVIEKNRFFESAVHQLMDVRARAVLHIWYRNWKFSRITRYYKRKNNEFIKQVYFGRWYDSMVLKFRLRRKFRYVSNQHNQKMLQYHFDFWYNKFFNLNLLNEKREKLVYLTEIHILTKSFNKFVSSYNFKLYLTQTEECLVFNLESLKKRHYLESWMTKTSRKQKYSKMISKISSHLKFHKMNYFYHQWKSKFLIISHYRNLYYKVKNLYKSITQRKFLLQWYSEYKFSKSNRKSIERAVKFRCICLKLKAFRTLQNNVIFKKNEIIKQKLVEKTAKKAIKRRFLNQWKKKHLKFKRRYILISAVVKNWAFIVKQKMFQRWMNYIKLQHEKQIEYSNAQNVFQENQIAYVIDSFVKGCKVNQNHNTKEFLESNSDEFFSILTPKIKTKPTNSSFHSNDPIDPLVVHLPAETQIDNICNASNIISGIDSRLNEPKLPSFMKTPYSPKMKNDHQIRNIEKRFQELASKCSRSGSSDKDRAELLSLVKIMNQIRLCDTNLE
ncbi:hypothetical protein TRFO_16493 [Tritrichomonas foetus]|uniref:Sfi1 spindle body domain-containing protein n=1 Tax=Tritrichomonas foetus TaxID=1144522 RepID=A0A1J4KR36_9EUKA|nr:hypothetical protein TRFO_16493 [Tritrichomonas foetus]|eukprot:OHT13392.1 hypothetical protein TRFO_16493 [Tritrichomonas foetus]